MSIAPDLPPGLQIVTRLSVGEGGSVWHVRRDGADLVLRVGARSGGQDAAELAVFGRVTGGALVTPIEWGHTPGGRTFLLRPWIDGRPFDEAARDATPEQLSAWVSQLLDALARLHEAGLVHRDVKAGNVLVGADGVHLLDFDLAAQSGAAGARSGAGTPLHMAPEILLGQAHEPACDLFSLGVMLALALCGPADAAFHQRFPGRSFWAASGLDPGRLPERLAPLCLALVRRHPHERPAGARSAATLLHGADRPVPDVRLPWVAGRGAALTRLAERVRAGAGEVFALAVSDVEEQGPLLDALQIELALGGLTCSRLSSELLGRGGDLWLAELDRHATAVATCDLPPDEGAADACLAFLHAPRRRRSRFLLALPAEEAHALSDSLRRRGPAEDAGEIVHLSWPRLSATALGAHLDRLSAGSSPDVAVSLARSLHGISGGRLADVNTLLLRGEADGVWRAEGGAFTLLRSEWPAVSVDDTAREPLLHALDADARAVLSVLSLAERPFSADVLAAVVGRPVAESLAVLRARGLIVGGDPRDGRPPALADRRWAEWVVQRLAKDELADWHRRCADALSAHGAAAADVAWHRLAVARTTAELDPVLEIIERELKDGRLGTARRLLQRALLQDLPAAGARLAQLAARLDLAQGRSDHAREVLVAAFGEALALAEPGVRLIAAHAAEQLGRRDEARTLFASVRDDSEATREQQLAGLAGHAWGLFLDGAWEAVLAQTRDGVRPGDPDESAATLLNLRGVTLTRLHRHEEAAATLEDALARAAQEPLAAARCRLSLAQLDRRRGRPAAAIELLQDAGAAFAAAGHVQGRALTLNNLGTLYRDLGELARARELLGQAHALRLRCGDAHGAASSLGSLALVELDAGHVGIAVASLGRAAELMARGEYGSERAAVSLALAIALALAGRHVEAVAHLPGADRPPRPEHAALAARAEAVVHLQSGQGDLALSAARRALAAATGDGDCAEQFRAAALLLALQPDDTSAATAMEAAAATLDGRVRPAEAAFRLALARGVDDAERLEASLGLFEHAGRTDLLASASRALARSCDRAGQLAGRRRASSRAAEALDAVVDGLPASVHAAVSQRVERLVGQLPADGPTAGLTAEWFLACNRRLAVEDDLQGLLLAIVDMALQLTGARRGFLVLLDGEELVARVARGMDDRSLEGCGEGEGDEARFSRTIARQAIAARAPVSSTNAAADQRFAGTASIAQWQLRSVLCVPLLLRDGSAGALYVDDDRREAAFDDTDAARVSGLADQATLAIGHQQRRAEIERLNRRLAERVEYQAEELERTRAQLRRAGQPAPLGGLVGESDAMRRVHALVGRLAATDLHVLVTGPSGSGKDLVARALHEHSRRADKPIVVENVSALPASLLESELFGYVRGAFTGADRDRPGLFAEADGGSFFLDEIGEMPLELQAKLLRVVETGELRPVGGRTSIRVDVRIIAATHRDLAACVRSGSFRQDLYYRLNGSEIRLPSLSERLEDVPLLVAHFLAQLNTRHGTDKQVLPEVVLALTRRPWPGQVRELSHEVARLYFLSGAALDDVTLLREAVATARGSKSTGAPSEAEPVAATTSLSLHATERAAIERALAATGGRKDLAAKLLEISRAGLYAKLKRFGIRNDLNDFGCAVVACLACFCATEALEYLRAAGAACQ